MGFYVAAHCSCCGQQVPDQMLMRQLTQAAEHPCFSAASCASCSKCRLHCACLSAAQARIRDLEARLAKIESA